MNMNFTQVEIFVIYAYWIHGSFVINVFTQQQNKIRVTLLSRSTKYRQILNEDEVTKVSHLTERERRGGRVCENMLTQVQMPWSGFGCKSVTMVSDQVVMSET